MPRPDSTDVIITLYVDTVGIQQYIGDENNPDVLKHIFIASNWTDSESPTETLTGSDGKTTFITDVHNNSQLSWVGATQDIIHNQDHYVLVTGVTAVPPNNIGLQPYSNLPPGSGDTHVDGRINPSARIGTSTKYTISFSVGVGPNIIGDFSVDPQLRMK